MPTVRSQVPSVRLTPEELERWKGAAEEAGKSLSTFVRESVEAKIGPAAPEDPQSPAGARPEPRRKASSSAGPKLSHAPGCFCFACQGRA